VQKKAPAGFADRRAQKGGTVQTHTLPSHKSQSPSAMPLRAIVEIIGGELKIYPIADSDTDEKTILDALRFVREQAA
jgi:hypothetical protein